MKLNWNEEVGHAISALGTPEFASSLASALREVCPFDYAVMFAYCGDARPIDLYDNFPASKRRVFVSAYQEGPYLLDPFFLACTNADSSGLFRLRQLAPDRFYQGEYFRSYYVQTGLSEEIGYFVQLPGAVTAVISLMRADHSAPFSAREFRELATCEPVVLALAGRQWHELHQRYSASDAESSQSNIQNRIEYAFRNFGKRVLTVREREVVEYVLKGYSSDAIGKILGISSGTVRIHRKNIYVKLGINSQGALFSQFIRALTSDEATE